ncbi:MAG: hypothetical protein FJ104_12020 [Deltaproteobacteria bacterium]|nr:hypothetical protein [Deltaproteobacteria bacterium]
MQCDGVPESCTEGADTPARYVFRDDDDCDGVADGFCLDQTLGEGGVSLTETFDIECKGAPVCRKFEYRGPEGRQTYATTDEGCDGSVERCEVKTYGDLPDLVYESFVDEGCDGTPDADCSNSVLMDDGRYIAVDDPTCDGTATRYCSTVSVDSRGNLRFREQDEDCDGIPEWCSEESDPTEDGSPRRSRHDPSCTGVQGQCSVST